MAKRITKFTALLLTLVMMLSAMSVTAFATVETIDTYIPAAPTKVGNNYPLSKTTTALTKDDKTTVTLGVPAEEVALGVDIIYVAGAYLKKDQVENDLMVESLYHTFKEAIEAGIPVSFGFVPFSYDDRPVMELTKYDTVEKLEAEFRDDLRDAIEAASGAYGGENMENALQIAKNMFAASDLATHPERQHLVLVSSGHTYNFNVGENNDIFSTVPVAINDSQKAGKYFYGFKAWMQARNYNPNNYPIPKAFTTYNDYRDWDAYWEAIDQWATADVAAGDKVVYNILDTTDYSFGYNDWYNTKYLGQDSAHDDETTFKSYGLYIYKAIQLALDNGFDFANVPYMKRGSLTGSASNLAKNVQHAISYERAMWEASNFIDKEITDAGINFYPIYNQMKPEYTNGTNANAKPYAHDVDWTNQFIGHSFMNFLAGDEQDNTAPLLFVMTDPNTGASEMAKNFFAAVEVEKLAQSSGVQKVPMFAVGPKVPALFIITQPVDAEGALGDTVSVSVEAQGNDLHYQWYFRNAGSETFSVSSIKTAVYETEMTTARAGRELYCVSTDALGNKVTTDTVTLVCTD